MILVSALYDLVVWTLRPDSELCGCSLSMKGPFETLHLSR